MSETRRYILDRNTGIAIGSAGTILLAAIGFHTWLSGQFQGLKDDLREVKVRVERIEELREDAWTKQQMRVWTLELQQANPALSVPDSRDQ